MVSYEKVGQKIYATVPSNGLLRKSEAKNTRHCFVKRSLTKEWRKKLLLYKKAFANESKGLKKGLLIYGDK